MTALAVNLLKPTGASEVCELAARELADSASLTLTVETERLFLGRISRCIFVTEGHVSRAAETTALQRATFGFAGLLRKRDLRVVGADSAARRLAETIVASPEVQREIAPLDLRRLELQLCADRWRLRAMLVGAAFVDMRLPPTRRYIPLGKTQAEALPRAMASVSAVLRDYLEG